MTDSQPDYRALVNAKIADLLQASPPKAAQAAQLLNDEEVELILTRNFGRVAVAAILYRARLREKGPVFARAEAAVDKKVIEELEPIPGIRPDVRPSLPRPPAPVPPGCQQLLSEE